MGATERSIGSVLRVVGSQPRFPANEAAAIAAMLEVVSRPLDSWGVFPGVQRRIAAHLVRRELDREWFEHSVNTMRDRLSRDEVRNPGALFLTWTKIELARRGISWRVKGRASA